MNNNETETFVYPICNSINSYNNTICTNCGAEFEYKEETQEDNNIVQKNYINNNVQKYNSKENRIAKIFKNVAWAIIFICSIVAFFMLLLPVDTEELAIVKSITIFSLIIYAFLGSLIYFAISEVIQLLYDIRNKMYEKK